jgi:hypothetical protein
MIGLPVHLCNQPARLPQVARYLEEALEIARRQRDEIRAAVEEVDKQIDAMPDPGRGKMVGGCRKLVRSIAVKQMNEFYKYHWEHFCMRASHLESRTSYDRHTVLTMTKPVWQSREKLEMVMRRRELKDQLLAHENQWGLRDGKGKDSVMLSRGACEKPSTVSQSMICTYRVML